MRLEKHTPEEIEQARSESGDPTPTEQQLEDWQRVKEQIDNSMVANAGADGFGMRIINLNGVILPLLGPEGLRVARGAGTSTMIELLKNKKTGAIFPWYKSGLLGYEHITEEALEGAYCECIVALSRFFSKVIEVEKGEPIDYWAKRFAAVFDHLANNGKIDYGVLSHFMALPLADIEAERLVQEATMEGLAAGMASDGLKDKLNEIRREAMDKAKTMRVALMVYPYSHLENDELNEWLGNPAFVDEGDIGTTDWTGLPEVDCDPEDQS